MIEDEYPSKVIKRVDKKKKEQIDDFMKRTTSEKNTLQGSGTDIIKVPELRIILVGKVCYSGIL